MAELAVGGKTRRLVVGISGRLVVGEVTVDALGWQTGVDTARVTRGAIERGVRSNKGVDRVGKGGAFPGWTRRAVADLTVGWKSCSLVVGVVGRLIVREVAVDAVERYCAVESAARMACLTSNSEVGTSERLTRCGAVIPGYGRP